MINFELQGVVRVLQDLAGFDQEYVYRQFGVDAAKRIGPTIVESFKSYLTPELVENLKPLTSDVNPSDYERARQWLKWVLGHAQRLEMASTVDRVEIFMEKLQHRMTLNDFQIEFRTLRETYERGLRTQHFYQYPLEKVRRLQSYRADWESALLAFPNISADVEAAVDCYAFGRNTASVFHSMRVVERGLREVALSINLTFEVEQWNTIIEQIESEIREIGKKWPRSAMKADWTRFYSEAAKEFFWFKDGWRNYVSHGGDPYDEHQAVGVIEHVKAFMNHLATRLGA